MVTFYFCFFYSLILLCDWKASVSDTEGFEWFVILLLFKYQLSGKINSDFFIVVFLDEANSKLFLSFLALFFLLNPYRNIGFQNWWYYCSDDMVLGKIFIWKASSIQLVEFELFLRYHRSRCYVQEFGVRTVLIYPGFVKGDF